MKNLNKNILLKKQVKNFLKYTMKYIKTNYNNQNKILIYINKDYKKETNLKKKIKIHIQKDSIKNIINFKNNKMLSSHCKINLN